MRIMKNKFFRITFVFMVLFTLAACKTAIQKTGVADQTSKTNQPANGSSNPNEQNPALSTNTPAVVQGSTEDGALWVKIDEPLDGAVVNTAQIDLKGHAAVGTTISINDDIQYLESSEEFTTKLNLTSGSNLIEIVASDVQGNEVDLYLTVYYEP
jgi:uncharacterized protein YfaP (DUF2135 family)